MAVGVLVEFDGATLAHYDAAIADAGLSAGGPGGEGCLFHWVGAIPGGIRVIDVWESRERFEQYAADTIIPATLAAGITAPPKIEFADVHNHFTAG